jgi:hypothetical protein
MQGVRRLSGICEHGRRRGYCKECCGSGSWASASTGGSMPTVSSHDSRCTNYSTLQGLCSGALPQASASTGGATGGVANARSTVAQASASTGGSVPICKECGGASIYLRAWGAVGWLPEMLCKVRSCADLRSCSRTRSQESSAAHISPPYSDSVCGTRRVWGACTS